MNIEIKNFLDKNIFLEIKNVLFQDRNFPWFYEDNIALKDRNQKRLYGFYHNFYYIDDIPYKSEYYPVIEPIVYKLFHLYSEKISLLRVRAGMNLIVDKKNIIHDPHIDYNFKHQTALLYMNTCDGSTIQYDIVEKKFVPRCWIQPEENKLLVFDGMTYHSSSTPTNNNRRIVININFKTKGDNE